MSKCQCSNRKLASEKTCGKTSCQKRLGYCDIVSCFYPIAGLFFCKRHEEKQIRENLIGKSGTFSNKYQK